ncbi:hypothetical protein [Candidatus Protochlamydia phocaeensis]|uniref:hypothetical protein n=1 Tax=Candidatus Protochlamydia phocaeensis TaxID=1414722 RepID=UPI0008383F39|nr:hypothetical protein [Candidatus Protochlamydia phocaeensis]
MPNLNFKQWKDAQPFIQDRLIQPENSRWGRAICYWFEKKAQGHVFQHVYAAAFDASNGDLYLDCSRFKISVKCLCLSAVFPVWMAIKTGYHLALPLSIPLEAFKALHKGFREDLSFKQMAHESGWHVVRNIADIIRTPLYGIALTVMCLAGAILGLFLPDKLYDIRKRIGELEKSLNWQDTQSFWTRAACFQPFENLMDVHERNRIHADTLYEGNPVLHGLNNYARALIQFKRRQRNLFEDCYQLQDSQDVYLSPAYPLETPLPASILAL